MGRAVSLQFHIPSLTVRRQCRTSVRESTVLSYGSGHQSHAPLIKKPSKKIMRHGLMHYQSSLLTGYITSRLNLYTVEALLLCRVAFVRILEVTWNKTRQSTFGIQIYYVTLPSNGYFVLSVYPSGKQHAFVHRKTEDTRVSENPFHIAPNKHVGIHPTSEYRG